MNIQTFFFVVLTLALTGCGDSSDSQSHNHGHGNAASPEPQAKQPLNFVERDGAVTTVRLSGNDRMKYNLEAFSVKTGSTVKIVFENKGKLPKTAMGHNVVFLKAGVDANAFVTAAAKARDSEYIPAAFADQILGYTKLLGPGETDTIEFTAPEAGEYAFVCSFPAHLYAGMVGVMTVE